MTKEKKAALHGVIICALGFAAGCALINKLNSNDKGLLELQIERTQLEIKILKKECAND